MQMFWLPCCTSHMHIWLEVSTLERKEDDIILKWSCGIRKSQIPRFMGRFKSDAPLFVAAYLTGTAPKHGYTDQECDKNSFL